jgi:hypothetical protein
MRVGADKLSGQGTVKGQWTSGIMFGANSNHVRRAAPCQHFTPAALKLTPGLNQTTADWDTLALTARRDARLGVPMMAGSTVSWISLPQM